MASYGHWATNKDEKMTATDFDYIAIQFADMISGEIKSGNSEGQEKGSQIRKTIRLQNGMGVIEASEFVNIRTNTIDKFEYNWQYLPDRQWKFHFDTFHPKKYWTETIHYHQHDEPTPNKSEHERIANFRLRDIIHILESIQLIQRYRDEWQVWRVEELKKREA